VIAVSSRHALGVLVLAAAAAIPIGWHAILAPTNDPCRDPTALLASERFGEGRVTDRAARPSKHGATQITGEVRPNPPGVFSMAFRMARGFQPTAFYGLMEVHEFDNSFPLDAPGDPVALDARGVRLPVRWLEDSFRLNFRVRGHFFVLDGQPVEYPFLVGLARAGDQLLGGTLPVTMFVFRAEGRETASDAMREHTRAWLRDAWEHYQKVCSR